MTTVEQTKIILEIRDYERTMSRDEQENFRMFVKRNKDDEDLDEISQKKLILMYEKYVVNRPKKFVKSPFGDTLEK